MNLDRFSHGINYSQQEPVRILGKCPGCGDDIETGDEVIEFEDVLIHNDSSCCRRYLKSVGQERIVG